MPRLLRLVITAAFGLAFLSVALPGSSGQTPPPVERISKFSEYKGYSSEVYDSWVRSSVYVPMRDGVKLAVDILRPAKAGKVETKPLPVLWTHTRYRRAQVREGKVRSSLEASPNIVWLKHGYVLAAADVRGSGASFGHWPGIFSKEETQDAFAITEWLAQQPWSDGNVGMFGGSYLGITQLMAASAKPPHLKAIVPHVALFDLIDVGTSGSVFRDDFLRTWSDLTQMLDLQPGVAPVDADKDRKLLAAALEEHKKNRPLIEIMRPLRFRDDVDPVTGAVPGRDWSPSGFVKEINESGVPMYLVGGWMDSFTRDQFLAWANFTAPKKLMVGVWSHSPRDPKIVGEEMRLLTVESLRWYDRWLKGIENGVMDGALIRYQTLKTPEEAVWKEASVWPIPEAEAVKFYFEGGKSGSAASVNDGRLAVASPPKGRAADEFKVDYTATSGTTTRWDNAVGGGFGYPDMAANDAKGLTYTTAPLAADLEITGHPVAHVWMSATSKDADLFAYLEEVDGRGVSTYVSEGVIKASYRALNPAPYVMFGLPYHRGFREDVKDLVPGEPVELVFELQPTSTVFDAENRIRLTLTGADKDNALTIPLDPAPVLTVYRDAGRPSFISLPAVGGLGAATSSAVVKSGAASLMLVVIAVALGIIVLTILLSQYMRSRLGKN
jgi:putative CocE/NonD family hydrolase